MESSKEYRDAALHITSNLIRTRRIYVEKSQSLQPINQWPQFSPANNEIGQLYYR